MKKLILVGMNPKTRGRIPWEGDNEIWTLNETPVNAWLKRYNALFQIHPRWDWERANNPADANHPLYIKSLSGTCLFCRGAGKVAINGGEEKKCPYCQEGQYNLPAHRAGKAIIMQDQNADVPGCVRLPIEDMTARFCPNPDYPFPYFTSTLAHMLVFAMHIGAPDIELYGFGMESDTEYAHQRPCVEYWIGYMRAKGIKVEAPGAETILKGEHYAYTTWAQGYRTRLGIRIDILRQQIDTAQKEAIKSEGALEAITPFKGMAEITPAWEQRYDDHFRRKQMLSFLNGARREMENSLAMFDAYYLTGEGPEPDAVKDLIGMTYQLG